ncbi:MAG: hypothetical protein JSS02_00505 [Planctomycetes bacterium]|nr:hypothetical protein [Planctomycetota bacterium]
MQEVLCPQVGASFSGQTYLFWKRLISLKQYCFRNTDMDSLDKLIANANDGTLLHKLTLEQKDIHYALDQRDHPSFDNKWMKASHAVDTLKGSAADADARVAQLRKILYLQSMERWESPDLAACISDDFGLIGDALITQYQNPWLNGLLLAYLSSRFPTGELQETPGLLEDAFKA